MVWKVSMRLTLLALFTRKGLVTKGNPDTETAAAYHRNTLQRAFLAYLKSIGQLWLVKQCTVMQCLNCSRSRYKPGDRLSATRAFHGVSLDRHSLGLLGWHIFPSLPLRIQNEIVHALHCVVIPTFLYSLFRFSTDNAKQILILKLVLRSTWRDKMSRVAFLIAKRFTHAKKKIAHNFVKLHPDHALRVRSGWVFGSDCNGPRDEALVAKKKH